MDTSTAQQKNPELLEEIEQLLTTAGISKEKQGEIFEKAVRLIMLRSINKLDDMLPEEEKKKLAASSPGALEDVTKHYKAYFSGEDLRKVFAETTEEVLVKIIDAV